MLFRSRELLKPAAFEEVVKQIPDKPFVEVWLRHGASDQELWDVPPDQESRGTSVLLVRLNDLFGVLSEGGLLMLDEIDTSLHPDLSAALVSLFTNKATNPKGAQLLFTTHDRSLLKSLRRDEVVLIDKSLEGVSTVKVASDFQGVRGRDDLRQLHEQGRLGGVPILGNLSGLFARLRENAT